MAERFRDFYSRNNTISTKGFIKGQLSCLRQFLATESPLKRMEKKKLFHLKSSFRYYVFKF